MSEVREILHGGKPPEGRRHEPHQPALTRPTTSERPILAGSAPDKAKQEDLRTELGSMGSAQPAASQGSGESTIAAVHSRDKKGLTAAERERAKEIRSSIPPIPMTEAAAQEILDKVIHPASDIAPGSVPVFNEQVRMFHPDLSVDPAKYLDDLNLYVAHTALYGSWMVEGINAYVGDRVLPAAFEEMVRNRLNRLTKRLEAKARSAEQLVQSARVLQTDSDVARQYKGNVEANINAAMARGFRMQGAKDAIVLAHPAIISDFYVDLAGRGDEWRSSSVDLSAGSLPFQHQERFFWDPDVPRVEAPLTA